MKSFGQSKVSGHLTYQATFQETGSLVFRRVYSWVGQASAQSTQNQLSLDPSCYPTEDSQASDPYGSHFSVASRSMHLLTGKCTETKHFKSYLYQVRQRTPFFRFPVEYTPFSHLLRHTFCINSLLLRISS